MQSKYISSQIFECLLISSRLQLTSDDAPISLGGRGMACQWEVKVLQSTFETFTVHTYIGCEYGKVARNELPVSDCKKNKMQKFRPVLVSFFFFLVQVVEVRNWSCRIGNAVTFLVVLVWEVSLLFWRATPEVFLVLTIRWVVIFRFIQ